MGVRIDCPLCAGTQTALAYHVKDSPIFQNKVYPTQDLANQVVTADIMLYSCGDCGFVFNACFDSVIMNYDNHYENEQAHSRCFQKYLDDIIQLFKQKNFQNKKIIEIGCGKGYFLELLVQQGFHVTGFDPAYTGNNPSIVKDYFSSKYNGLGADIIILRHVLEHIPQPLVFLQQIASQDAQIYIEVPALEWIIQHQAFWDIFYEHCNYFSFASLGGLFEQAEQDFLFNGQYMYLLADLKSLRTGNMEKGVNKIGFELSKFEDLLSRYRSMLIERQSIMVWGAGAKGVTFANLVDPDAKYISALVDINPKKQQRYIAKTAHKIISPEDLSQLSDGYILVMNDNYFDEIQSMVSPEKFNVVKLRDFIEEDKRDIYAKG